MKKNILLLLISTITILVICEVLIRIVLPQINDHDSMFQFEKELGWEFIPGKKGEIVYEGGIWLTVEVNDDGYRDVPFIQKKGETKIMVLGDSFVSNVSVENDEVFTQLIENELTDTSVYNFGVNGYGQVQEYLVLKKWLPRIQPDIIVVVVYLRNDFTDNINKNNWLYSRPTMVFDTNTPLQIIPPSKNYKTKEALPFYYKSHLYRFVKKSISNIKSKTEKERNASYIPPEVYTCRNPLSEDTKAMYETMQQLLLEIYAYGRSKNTPVVFALAPSMFQVEDDLWSQVGEYDPSISLKRDIPNTTLLAFAKANNLQMIDLMPSLKESHRNGIKVYNAQEQHWTVEGNKVVANVLSEYIQQKMTRAKDSL